jgi:hypothetical protein
MFDTGLLYRRYIYIYTLVTECYNLFISDLLIWNACGTCTLCRREHRSKAVINDPTTDFTADYHRFTYQWMAAELYIFSF